MKEYGFVEFCDDYREEKNGKVTLVGLYQNDLIVAYFPALLPKFVMVINIMTFNKTTTDIPVEIEIDGEVIITANTKFSWQDKDLLKKLNIWRGAFPIILSPFVFQKEGALTVRIGLNGKMENIGQIYIRKPKQAMMHDQKAKKKKQKK
jgi:hypothetical protein